jgi:hypothetical protein
MAIAIQAVDIRKIHREQLIEPRALHLLEVRILLDLIMDLTIRLLIQDSSHHTLLHPKVEVVGHRVLTTIRQEAHQILRHRIARDQVAIAVHHHQVAVLRAVAHHQVVVHLEALDNNT